MDKQLMLKKFIENELERAELLKKEFDIQMGKLPKGAIIERDGNYYVKGREGGKQFMVALDPGDSKIYRQLQLRRYISKELPILEKKIKIYSTVLEKERLLDPCEIRKKLPDPYRDLSGLGVFLRGDFDPEQWASQDYKRNPFYRESLIHKTENGIKTRSKSEAMIGTQLERSGLHFRVEEELVLAGRTFYPDFTVLLQDIRRLIYWEHLGLVDDPEYMIKNLGKLTFYSEHGVILGYNLVITYETREHPLTIDAINRTIKKIRRMGDTESESFLFW